MVPSEEFRNTHLDIVVPLSARLLFGSECQYSPEMHLWRIEIRSLVYLLTGSEERGFVKYERWSGKKAVCTSVWCMAKLSTVK